MANDTPTVQGTMNAVVLHEYGSAEQLKYEHVPVPKPGAGEILVRVAAVSLNPVDWKLRSGALKEYMPLELPTILGRDVSGTVETVGAGVAGFRIGDRVLGLVRNAYAEFVVSKEEDFAPMPEGMSFETAAALPLVMLTGEQLIRQAAQAQAGQTVLVTGALGGVGRSAVHTALKAGCRVLAGVRAKQRAEAMALGVADVIAVDDATDLERLAPYDVVADTLGHDVAAKLVTLVRPGGVFASVLGDPANAKERSDVRFAPMMAHADSVTLARMAQEVQQGEFEIPVGRRFPLKEAALAQETAEKGGIRQGPSDSRRKKSMKNYMTALWQRVSAQDSKIKAEVGRIAVLQKAAAGRRAEFAEKQDTATRNRMEEAEFAHTAALQAWENKQSRQKSR